MAQKHKNSDEANKHTPKGFDNASNFSRLLRDEIGASRYTREFALPPAIEFVDGSNVPPTTNLNDIYVLVDTGGGSVNANWGAVSYNDWVRYNGETWGSVTPVEGDICFDSNAGYYKIFGTSWGQLVPEAENMSNADLTFGANHYADLSTFSWVLGGTAPIGTEKISFQKDTLIKGSDTSSSTTGLKFVDSTNASLWDFRNNGNIHQGKDSIWYLGDNKFTLFFDEATATESAPINFEFGSAFGGYYSRWDDLGGLVIKSASTYALNVLSKVDATSSMFRVGKEGGGFMSTNGSRIWTISDSTAGTTKLEIDQERVSQFWNGTEYHRIQTSGSGTGISFFRSGITGSLGIFSVGGTSALGTEKISLQEDTLVGKTGSKVGFMGTAPIVKITTGVSAGAFTANTSGIADDTATFGGYTIGQIAQALINYGLLT